MSYAIHYLLLNSIFEDPNIHNMVVTFGCNLGSQQ